MSTLATPSRAQVEGLVRSILRKQFGDVRAAPTGGRAPAIAPTSRSITGPPARPTEPEPEEG